jgi:virginiamycin B lyase
MSAVGATSRGPIAAGFRRRWWLAIGLAAAMAAGAILLWRFGPWRPSGFVEYRMPSAGDIPTAVAVGRDGSVWFTIESSDAIGILRGGRIEKLHKGKMSVEPMGLAIGADGAAWFTDSPARAVSRMAGDGAVTSFVLTGTPIARLHQLAIAPDGAVWFADSTALSITRLRDGLFTPHMLASFRPNPYGVAVDATGTVWATLQGANKLARVTPDGPVAEIEIPTRGSGPSDIAVSRDGAVWFVEFRANKIGCFAAGRFSEIPAPTAQAALTGLAVAPDGAVWFGELRVPALGRLRGGIVTEFKLPRRDARPFSVAVDDDGNVWYTDLHGWLGKLSAERARAGS